MTEPLLTVSNLSVRFQTDEGIVTAVDDLSFTLSPGQTLGIVGESGSGKSVSTRALMQLLPDNATIDPGSRILYQTKKGEFFDIAKLRDRSKDLNQIRGGEIAMIFQEPSAAFSPLYTIGQQMIEGIRLHRQVSRDQARKLAIEMLERVGMTNPDLRVDQYVFQLSGGMRQRAMIALALAMRPAVLIADEPTTALDVTLQAQILDLLTALQDDFGMAILFISHDLAVISQIADDVLVMYLGREMEMGPVRNIIRSPQHPYTQGLIKAIPRLNALDQPLTPIPGDIPSPLERPQGCVFHTRCPQAAEHHRCRTEVPMPVVRTGPTTLTRTHHLAACHLVQEDRTEATPKETAL
ncbi:MAG: ABC transporter ATP-binding protein [Cyanobacteria bacterium J06626_23]